MFPFLFSLLSNLLGNIMEMGVREGQGWLGKFHVATNVLLENRGVTQEALKLLELLGVIGPEEGGEDVLKWWPNPDSKFSIKNCTSCLREYDLEVVV